jgi:ribosome-associated protein
MGVKDYESKTKAKAAAHELQGLGKQLAKLSLATLRALELPERLYDAFEVLSRTRGNEGTRRQMQYIGKLMRLVDAEPIEARLGLLNNSSQESKALFKKCEVWRDDLLNPTLSENTLTKFCEAFPAADAVKIREMITTSLFEKAEGKPPKHSRLLFRAVQNIVTA